MPQFEDPSSRPASEVVSKEIQKERAEIRALQCAANVPQPAEASSLLFG